MKKSPCIGLALLIASVLPRSAHAVLVDGLSVTFNTLPTVDITSGLEATSVAPAATFSGFIGGQYSYTYWGETNPFTYAGAQRADSVPQFDAVKNGAANYVYASPQSTFSLLWGSVDPDNTVTFFQGSQLLDTLTGADLIAAELNAGLSAAQVFGNPFFQPTLDISVSLPGGFDGLQLAGASNSLTFEYSNLVASATAVPEPGTWILMSLGLLVGISLRVKAVKPAR